MENKYVQSHIAEAYRSIRSNIEFSKVDTDVKTILITSSRQDEGKSTVSVGLAESFASLEDTKVLLIDSDLRNPTVHKYEHISNTFGVSDILAGKKRIDECINRAKKENLHIISTGKTPPDPADMLASKKMAKLIETVREHYDYVIIDSAPIGVVSDASNIASVVDGVVLVGAANEVDMNAMKDAKQRLDNVDANILGVIINKVKVDKKNLYGYYYGSEDKKGRKKKK